MTTDNGWRSETRWAGLLIGYTIHSDSGPGIDPAPYVEWEVTGIHDEKDFRKELRDRAWGQRSEGDSRTTLYNWDELAEQFAERYSEEIEDYLLFGDDDR